MTIRRSRSSATHVNRIKMQLTYQNPHRTHQPSIRVPKCRSRSRKYARLCIMHEYELMSILPERTLILSCRQKQEVERSRSIQTQAEVEVVRSQKQKQSEAPITITITNIESTSCLSTYFLESSIPSCTCTVAIASCQLLLLLLVMSSLCICLMSIAK